MQWKRTSGSRARTRGNTSRRRTSAPRRRSADAGSRRRTPGPAAARMAARPRDVVHVRQHLHPRAGRIAGEQRALGGADHQGDVGSRDELQAPRARGRAAARSSVASPASSRRAALAQVMQIDACRTRARLRRMAAQQRQELAGDVMARYQHHVEARAAFAQPGRCARRERRVQVSTPSCCSASVYRPASARLSGRNTTCAPSSTQHAHQVDHAQRAGVLVRLRRRRIDDQHRRLSRDAASRGRSAVPGGAARASAAATCRGNARG